MATNTYHDTDLTKKQFELLKSARDGLLASEGEKRHKADLNELRDRNLVKTVQLSHPQVNFTEEAITTTDDGERILNAEAQYYDLEKQNATLVEGGEKKDIQTVKVNNPVKRPGEKAEVKETTVKPDKK